LTGGNHAQGKICSRAERLQFPSSFRACGFAGMTWLRTHVRGTPFTQGSGAVLKRPLNDAGACLQHAAACELQAERANDPAAKRSFFDVAARWRRIAATFEYIDRVDEFLAKPRK
jgi:hypothetical protein